LFSEALDFSYSNSSNFSFQISISPLEMLAGGDIGCNLLGDVSQREWSLEM